MEDGRLTLGLIKEGTCHFNIEWEIKSREVNCCEAFGKDDLQPGKVQRERWQGQGCRQEKQSLQQPTE